MVHDKPGAHGTRASDRAMMDQVERKIELRMDEMGAESFPASDPPVFGSLASRLREAREESGERSSETATPEVAPTEARPGPRSPVNG